jgi:hypothetical protein
MHKGGFTMFRSMVKNLLNIKQKYCRKKSTKAKLKLLGKLEQALEISWR